MNAVFSVLHALSARRWSGSDEMRFMTSLFSVAPSDVRSSIRASEGSSRMDEAGVGQEVIFLAGGCFWGVEKAMWNAPGVVSTTVGYMGGHTPDPTYEQVCAHASGHAETVRVLFDTARTNAVDLIRLFFEVHDPTQVGGQGNDIGDQYRSVIWTTTPAQFEDALALRDAYQEVLTERGFGPIQTRIAPAPAPNSDARFWLAEEYHQRYLFKNPGGYECHARTGIACPTLRDK